MQPLKIVIALVSLIVLAIVIGSNLSPLVTVVVLSQPTVMLPVGVWFIMAIGLGLLSSGAIQLLIWLQNRALAKRVRQLQTRLREMGDDVFSYKPSEPSEPPVAKTRSSTENFQSRTSSPNFTTPPPVNPQSIDRDDWEYAPVAKPQPEWEDISPSASPPRQQTETSPQRRTYVDDNLPEQEGVYDADFRLIQPPYKAPLEVEADEDDEYEYDDEEIDDEDLAPPSQSAKSTRVDDGETEDWGFDFDEKPPLQPRRF